MYCVKDFYTKYSESLGLVLLAGKVGLDRFIKVAEVQGPGLGLSGYLKGYTAKRFLVFGDIEIRYLRDLNKKTRLERLRGVLGPNAASLFPTDELPWINTPTPKASTNVP